MADVQKERFLRKLSEAFDGAPPPAVQTRASQITPLLLRRSSKGGKELKAWMYMDPETQEVYDSMTKAIQVSRFDRPLSR